MTNAIELPALRFQFVTGPGHTSSANDEAPVDAFRRGMARPDRNFRQLVRDLHASLRADRLGLFERLWTWLFPGCEKAMLLRHITTLLILDLRLPDPPGEAELGVLQACKLVGPGLNREQAAAAALAGIMSMTNDVQTLGGQMSIGNASFGAAAGDSGTLVTFAVNESLSLLSGLVAKCDISSLPDRSHEEASIRQAGRLHATQRHREAAWKYYDAAIEFAAAKDWLRAAFARAAAGEAFDRLTSVGKGRFIGFADARRAGDGTPNAYERASESARRRISMAFAPGMPHELAAYMHINGDDLDAARTSFSKARSEYQRALQSADTPRDDLAACSRKEVEMRENILDIEARLMLRRPAVLS